MIRAAVIALSLATSVQGGLSAEERRKNTWEEQYRARTPQAMAAEFESPTRAVFRYRVAIPSTAGCCGRSILTVLDAKPGQQIYKVRVGGGGHTFSASPVAAGNRILLLTEDGLTFVLDSGSEYKEIGRDDLAEMSRSTSARNRNCTRLRARLAG